MGKVLDCKCLSCGASIKFNPSLNKFKCEYCKSEFTLEEINNHKEKVSELDKFNSKLSLLEDMTGYHCNNCGAEIVSLENISSTTCIYCKSNAIIKDRLSGIYKPDSIIPFKYKKEDAIKAFLDICKDRLLLPKGFNSSENIHDMEGLYVPFWLYDIENEARLQAIGTKISTWMDSKYVYTKTSIFRVKRGAKIHFNSIPNDAAIRFDDGIMNAIEPFNYNDLVSFDTNYLAGFLSEKYDVSKDNAYLNAKERIEEDSKNYLKDQMKGYNSINIKKSINNINIIDTRYVFLPVFVLNIKYKDKIYHFAMNGQTGKLVGEIPVDTKKLILAIFTTLISSFLLLLLIFLVLGYRW